MNVHGGESRYLSLQNSVLHIYEGLATLLPQGSSKICKIDRKTHES